MSMNRFLYLIPLVLTGCTGPMDAWINPGVDATRAERTLLMCEAEARQDFPVAMQTEWNSAITIGGRFCNDPFCFGAARGLPTARQQDVNADLRKRAVDLCMKDAGYTKVQVPQCPADITPLELSQHPSSTKGICLVDGAFALKP
jgi:hypothetical protein